MEFGSRSVRIRGIAHVLGGGGDGSVDPPHRWLWNSAWNRRWPGALSHVYGLWFAESVLVKHQLLIANRSRRRAPNLRVDLRDGRAEKPS